ncbi:response regulator [Deinococcus sedimenti]|uniref:Response regulator n=1 Tax=Deinococcus sedimenti TaxID=1867090 RepID=A0ABQ2S9E7_9DEIO|nr:response regulator [Deinococcus sedimenti]GGS10171.1 response regulator [Deinococcus sedimenti]
MKTSRPTRRLCVLLVDDNPADCLLAEEAFAAADQDVTVRTIQSGEAALRWLQERAQAGALPDVIILDVNMPSLSGLEVLQAIRADTAFRHLPVVMLSTSSHPEDVDRAYDLIASSYLVKEPSFGAFAAQIEDFVRYWQRSRFRTAPSSH